MPFSLRHRQHWNIDDFERAISREALTTSLPADSQKMTAAGE
jgi:hypothetical protein